MKRNIKNHTIICNFMSVKYQKFNANKEGDRYIWQTSRKKYPKEKKYM